MTVKRSFAVIMVALLLLTAGAPSYAAAEDIGLPPEGGVPTETVPPQPDNSLPGEENPILPTVPAFTAELVSSSTGWSLYGTLSEMTENMTAIIPCYSMDGVEYTPEEGNAWILDPDDPDMLKQQSFWAGDTPLKEYFAGEIERFYVKMQITYADGTEAYTDPAEIKREEPVPLPEDYLVEAWYAAPIRVRVGRPSKFWGQYHFTVPDTATPEELAALLPQTVPVELQIYQNSDPNRNIAVVDYTALWPEEVALSGGADTDVLAVSVTPPPECTVTIGTAVYVVKPPAILPDYGPELHATFHAVAAGGGTEVLLSTDESTQIGGIRATFPQKPTGAVGIVPEYSVDGGETWTSLEDVLGNAPLEENPPKFENYTVRILGNDSPPLTAYLNEELPGFFVRLRVEGGALAGTTLAAAWPTHYDYVPPRDDSNDQGSGGNENNTGSGGGTGGSSSGNGGQRPEGPPVEWTPIIIHPPVLTEPVPSEEPVVQPTPTPTPTPAPTLTLEPVNELPVPTPAIEPSVPPVAPAQTKAPSPPIAPATPPTADVGVPVVLPEITSAPEEKEDLVDTIGDKASVPLVAEPIPVQSEEPPRGAGKAAGAPLAAAGVLLLGGVVVAVSASGGGAGAIDAGRKLMAAIKRVLRHTK